MPINQKEIPLAEVRLPIFKKAAGQYHFPDEVAAALSPDLGSDWLAWILAGIDSRESGFGLLLDSDGLGDQGHGHGEMQIDDRSHTAFCASGLWRDLAASLEYDHKGVIVPNFNELGNRGDLFDDGQGGIDYGALFWAAIAAYNCGAGGVLAVLEAGEDVDARTTGGNYSADVRARALGLLQALGGKAVPVPVAKPHIAAAAEDYGIDFPIMQNECMDIFGEPDEGGPFTAAYVRFCDLSEFQPQLAHVKGLHSEAGFGFYCNYVMIKAVQQALREICGQGLAHELISFDGCHCVRAMKSNSSTLSMHSYALAIDWNAAQNPFTYGPLVSTWSKAFIACWQRAGFEWGGSWSSCHDAMHWQFALTRSMESWEGSGSPWIPAIPYQEAA